MPADVIVRGSHFTINNCTEIKKGGKDGTWARGEKREVNLTAQNSKQLSSVTSTPALDSTSCPRKKSPTGNPWTSQRRACGTGVPVGALRPEMVVVIARVVVGLEAGLPVMGSLGKEDEDAGMKIIEDIIVAGWVWWK